MFDAGDIVVARFPHVERGVIVSRPAVIVSAGALGPDGLLLWVAMVTNAARPQWPGDVVIPDAAARGLRVPSKIRAVKVATVEAAGTVRIGCLDAATRQALRDQLRTFLGL